MSGNKEPASEGVWEQPQGSSSSRELDEINSDEFSQENIERIYRRVMASRKATFQTANLIIQ